MARDKITFIALGIFLIAFGIFAMNYAVYRGRPVRLFWFCYLGMVLIGLGVFLKSSNLIVSQLNILTIPLIFWLVDFFYLLTTGKNLWGITAYFFDNLLLSARIIALEHFFILPLSFLALYLIRKAAKFAWFFSLIEVTFIFAVLRIFSSAQSNVNCVFKSCFPWVLDGFWYPVKWFVLLFLMIIITNFLLNKILVFQDKEVGG